MKDGTPLRDRLRSSRVAWLIGGTALLAMAGTPIALAAGDGDVLHGGARNPSGGQTQEFTKETEIIAQTAKNTYGTRQSNKGDGGGAIYGCRAKAGTSNLADPADTTPCLRVNNLDNGLAFQFAGSTGNVLGVIQQGQKFSVNNDNAKPFITNATGVATGLNADRVDSKSADDIVKEAQSAIPQTAFARVLKTPNGTDTVDDAQSNGIADSSVTHPATGVYCFDKIAFTPKAATATLEDEVGFITAKTQGDDPACPGSEQIAVKTYDKAGSAADAAFTVEVR